LVQAHTGNKLAELGFKAQSSLTPPSPPNTLHPIHQQTPTALLSTYPESNLFSLHPCQHHLGALKGHPNRSICSCPAPTQQPGGSFRIKSEHVILPRKSLQQLLKLREALALVHGPSLISFWTSPHLSPLCHSFCFSHAGLLALLQHNEHAPTSGSLYQLFGLPPPFILPHFFKSLLTITSSEILTSSTITFPHYPI